MSEIMDALAQIEKEKGIDQDCLLYTSDAADD